MSRAVMFHRLGGPEVLEIETVALPEPGPGEVRIRVQAIGLNRGEAWFRRGTYYELPRLPRSRIGTEAAGVVDALGPDVAGFAVGEPVSTVAAFSMRDHGVYADQAVVPAAALVRREGIDPVTGAAVWNSYLTAYGALVDVARLRAGDAVLITAASSTVGLAAIQIANHLGAVPIATTRTGAKRQRLLDAGAAQVIATEEEDLVALVDEITGGQGVEVAFDGVAGAAVNTLARVIAPGGQLIIYGWFDPAPIPLPIAPDYRALSTRVHAVFETTTDRERLRRAEHFIRSGLRSAALRPAVDRVFDLGEIVRAHEYLESDRQTGKIVVTVEH